MFSLLPVKPETVIAWHRQGLSLVVDLEESTMNWTTGGPDRRPQPIRTMSQPNPLWGGRGFTASC